MFRWRRFCTGQFPSPLRANSSAKTKRCGRGSTPTGPGARAGSNNGRRKNHPYRGLASFTAADAQDFFGREAEAQAVANRLRVNPLLAMVGPSGVGKSSFVQAGVAPLLAQELQLVVVRPGNTPLATLVAKIKALGVDTEGLLGELAKDPSALGRRLVAFARAQKTSYLLVVDQFEELLTLCANAEERDRYAAVVVGAAKNPDDPVRVVLTLRDDFLIRAQGLEALKDHLSTGLHLLATPSENDLLRILTQPLKRVGFAFEDAELPRQMVAEVAQQPGALALLSFSATRLWEARDAHFHKLTRKAYQAMGGVGGALAGHREENLAAMSEEEREAHPRSVSPFGFEFRHPRGADPRRNERAARAFGVRYPRHRTVDRRPCSSARSRRRRPPRNHSRSAADELAAPGAVAA